MTISDKISKKVKINKNTLRSSSKYAALVLPVLITAWITLDLQNFRTESTNFKDSILYIFTNLTFTNIPDLGVSTIVWILVFVYLFFLIIKIDIENNEFDELMLKTFGTTLPSFLYYIPFFTKGFDKIRRPFYINNQEKELDINEIKVITTSILDLILEMTSKYSGIDRSKYAVGMLFYIDGVECGEYKKYYKKRCDLQKRMDLEFYKGFLILDPSITKNNWKEKKHPKYRSHCLPIPEEQKSPNLLNQTLPGAPTAFFNNSHIYNIKDIIEGKYVTDELQEEFAKYYKDKYPSVKSVAAFAIFAKKTDDSGEFLGTINIECLEPYLLGKKHIGNNIYEKLIGYVISGSTDIFIELRESVIEEEKQKIAKKVKNHA